MRGDWGKDWVRGFVATSDEQLDRRLPDVLREPGEDSRRRARLLLAVQNIMAVASLVGVLVRYQEGAPLALNAFPAVLALVAMSIPTILRRTRSLTFASHLFVGSYIVVLGLINVRMAGHLTGVQTAIAVLPLLGVLILGPKKTLPWTITAFLLLAVGFVLRDHGSWHPSEALVQSIRSASTAAPMIVLGVVHFVASWYEMQRARAAAGQRQAREHADQANIAKGEFLSHMSHELRTPMNGVLGALDIVHDTSLTADQRKYIKVCRDSARHMLRLLNEILDETKLASGAVELERVAVDMQDLLNRVSDGVLAVASAKGLSFVTRFDFDAGSTIIGDSVRLRQLVMNLLNNALKFTETGTITLAAKSQALPEGRLQLDISVKDTGVGIPPEAIANLFEAFTQAEASTTRRFGGTGLGLRITKQIADLMGAELEVESEVGQGSTFSVRFQALACDIEVVEPSADLDSPSVPPKLRDLGLKVLVAEDNSVNQMIIERMLLVLGCESVCVANGREAVEQARTHAFHCILMDCQMPIMDGYEASRELRAGGEQTPIVALTAHVQSSERGKCLDAGMNDMVSKPVSLQGLAETLVRWAPALESRELS